MWDGRPETRADSHCPFCDTDFFSHDMLTANQIADQLMALWEPEKDMGWTSWVTISGGESAMQIDQGLIDTLHSHGYKVAIETNGTRHLQAERVDHITLSPKLPETQTVIKKCHTLKLLWPHPNPLITPESFSKIQAEEFYLQPITADSNAGTEANIASAIDKLYSLATWKLSLQTHKMIGVE